MTMTYPFASELREELEARGRQKGRAEGYVEGRHDGQALGHFKGRTETLLRLLTIRGFELTSSQRQEVLECLNEQRFDTWLTRALTASSADEVFGPEV